MCRNPLFAVWSRLKSWCMGGSWRASALLVGVSWTMAALVIAMVVLFPDAPSAGVLTFAICVIVACVPNLVYRRRIAAALRPVRLDKEF